MRGLPLPTPFIPWIRILSIADKNELFKIEFGWVLGYKEMCAASLIKVNLKYVRNSYAIHNRKKTLQLHGQIKQSLCKRET